ncbi:MAG: hypothetical protein JWO31_776, partial [Phycisphaerales bacterium]|nr:hypothetical protein [Phycisphaerales bacterium]
RQGRPPGQVADDAAAFFNELMGGRGTACAACFHPDDLAALQVFRAQWV